MDWSKAKTILIIVLLAVCLWLSGTLIYKEALEKKATADAAMAAKEYLEYQGASLITDIPLARPKLPVIFITMQEKEDASAKALTEYSGYAVCYEEGPFVPVLSSIGKGKAKVGTASSALLAAAAQLSEELGTGVATLKNLEVKGISLVYYADVSMSSAGAKDTAIPSWRIETNKGTIFINAF